MLTKLLHRNIAAVNRRLVLLPPPNASVPSSFGNVDVDARRHADLVRDMQRLRGSVYLRDGALQPQHLSQGGLHQTPEDKKSWHLLMLDTVGRVAACVWYTEHEPTVPVDRLRVRHCPLAQQSAWRKPLWNAVEAELARARQDGLGYAEVGGWAVGAENNCTSDGLVLALAGYSLGRVLGGALGITTATVRHCSSTILRRLGGSDLTAGDRKIPSYYDPRYDCDMELLRFDSREPNPKYNGLVELLVEKLADVLVLAPVAVAARSAFDFFTPEIPLEQSLLA